MSGNIRPWRGTLPTLGQRVYVDPAAVVIGRVTLGDDSSVWPMTVIRGDINVIRVGARTSVQDGSVLHVTHDGPYWPGGFALTIGNDVTIGHRAVLHGCTVGNRCLIGMSSLVMDDAVVEDEVIVAAGAVVTPGTRCESRSLYVGTPARRARALTEREIGQLAYNAGWYVTVKDQYLTA
ncbi:MAG: UDP-3-O-[3-hydroxymyristoyl] glucosamine N-acyltransferase [Proteobacteria bacterium]|nr:UDP-3-O-[3-hydroxymyristoyl] glucosamine N-acyltransferase [Pseudomonadota bacterium]